MATIYGVSTIGQELCHVLLPGKIGEIILYSNIKLRSKLWEVDSHFEWEKNISSQRE